MKTDITPLKTKKSQIMKLLKGEASLTDVWHYIIGHLRYKAYYSKRLKWLIRVHIREQIKYRITWMDQDCFDNGYCKKCGCETTALQMANKSCDRPCYPAMMNKDEWRRFKLFFIIRKEGINWYQEENTREPIMMVEKSKFYVPKDKGRQSQI